MIWDVIKSPVGNVVLLSAAAAVSEAQTLEGASSHTVNRAEGLKAPLRRSEFLRSRWLWRQVSGRADFGMHPDGDGLWPVGLVGSVTHKNGHVGLAYSREERRQSLGIDLERTAVNANLMEKIVREDEVPLLGQHLSDSETVSLIFSAKEALFKAVFPVGRKMFWFHHAKLTSITNDTHVFRLEFRVLADVNVPTLLVNPVCVDVMRCQLASTAGRDDLWLAVCGLDGERK